MPDDRVKSHGDEECVHAEYARSGVTKALHRACSQTLAAVLASTTIDNEGLGGPREGMSKGGSSVVADADVEEPGGQHVAPTGGPGEPADYKEAPSEVRAKMIPHEKLMLVGAAEGNGPYCVHAPCLKDPLNIAWLV
jgi:hypothetical protein